MRQLTNHTAVKAHQPAIKQYVAIFMVVSSLAAFGATFNPTVIHKFVDVLSSIQGHGK